MNLNPKTETQDLTRTAFVQMRDALLKAEDRADTNMMDADTDCLTGLLNRRGLDRRTQHRDWGHYVAADLDGFKAAQDSHPDGHAYGDTILEEFADFLIANTRQRDMRARDLLTARTGGDEFTIWTETRVGALRIQEAIRGWASSDGAVSASAGTGGTTKEADAECYLNKTETRDAR